MVNSGQGTVTQQFTKAIVAALESSELPASTELDQLLDEIRPFKRVPMPLQDELWQTLVTLHPEPDLGLKLGNRVQPGHLDVVGFLLLSCDTLDDALDVLLTYHPIVGEGGEFLSTDDDTTCRLIYAPFHNVVREQRVEAVMATLVQLTRYLTADAFEPDCITFQHAAQMPVEHYEKLLGCPVRFNELVDAMIFPKSSTELPLVQANSALFDQMRALADDQLSQLQQLDIRGQVARLVQEHPKWGKERIAEALGMSGRHLNRNLAREGVTFKILADQTRQGMVKDLLAQHISKADIAERLGFHDESALSKAFKRWTGMTPTEYLEKSQG